MSERRERARERRERERGREERERESEIQSKRARVRESVWERFAMEIGSTLPDPGLIGNIYPYISDVPRTWASCSSETTPSPRATVGPYAESYCRVLGGRCFL